MTIDKIIGSVKRVFPMTVFAVCYVALFAIIILS
jgi:hypothetical protein